MRALRLLAKGSQPELCELPEPVPGPGEALVELRAAGVNFADLLMIEGRYQAMPPLPLTLGMEGAGILRALGPGTLGPPVGTRVAVFAGQGCMAGAGVFAADRLLPLPPGMSYEQAAGFQIAYGTAHLALTRRARLRAGETLVVLGAAGGVGLTAVEVGARLGARVIAVARGAARLDAARRAGAAETVEAEDPDLKARLRALGGADVIYDPVGGAAFGAALGALRPEGRALVIGFASGEVPQVPANHLLVKNVDVLGFWWGGYLAFAPEAVADSLRELLGWFERGLLVPPIGQVLPLERWSEGLDLLRQRRATGKVVLTP